MRCLCRDTIALTLVAALCGPTQMALLVGREAPATINDPAPVGDGGLLSPDTSLTATPWPGAAAAPVVGAELAEYGRSDRFWVQGDYLFWWLKPGPLATPLVTTDPSQGVAKGSGGLANPTTQVLVGGSTSQIAVAGGTQSLPGGWLALPSNSGTFHHDAFAVVPEVNGNVGYDVRPWLRLSVGYDFLYWSSVVRPGAQMVPEASAGAKVPPPFGQVPTFPGVGPGAAPVPPVPYHTTSFWAHGLSIGAGLRF